MMTTTTTTTTLTWYDFHFYVSLLLCKITYDLEIKTNKSKDWANYETNLKDLRQSSCLRTFDWGLREPQTELEVNHDNS